MTLHGVIYGFKDDKVVPLRATMEIHSSGSAGFTLSVLDITGASAKQPWPVPIAELSSRYLTGPELPVRIEGHDSKFRTWTCKSCDGSTHRRSWIGWPRQAGLDVGGGGCGVPLSPSNVGAP